jgi:stearoyl-CoA desaturase (delta-9 desaturase)
VHHKYTETVKDPGNVTRGFLFAHFGWLMEKYTPECQAEMDRVDISDLTSDKDIMFQYK